MMGLAILGLAFTGSYSAGFARHSADFVQQLPPAAYEALREDPTITLDETRFAPVRAAIETQPEGPALLARTLQAQREGVCGRDSRGVHGHVRRHDRDLRDLPDAA
jgi:hypothetical protein